LLILLSFILKILDNFCLKILFLERIRFKNGDLYRLPENKKMGSNIDLRKYQESTEIEDAFGKILSGKSGYKPIIERRVDPAKCLACGLVVDGHKNFCPQCGGKLQKKPTSIKCAGCGELYDGEEAFCGHCGKKRE